MSLLMSKQSSKLEKEMFQWSTTSVYVLSSCELRIMALRSLCTKENKCSLIGVEKCMPENLGSLQSGCPDIIVIDIDLFQNDSSRTLIESVEILKDIAYVLVIASYLDMTKACAAIAHGASGYLLTSTSHQSYVHVFHIVSSGGTWLEEDLRRKMLNSFFHSPVEEEKSSVRFLSSREFQILQKVSRGETNRTIAEDLYLSESSVRTYWQRVLIKLNAFSKVEAITRAIKLGLLELDRETEEDLLSVISPRLRLSLQASLQKRLPPAPPVVSSSTRRVRTVPPAMT